MVTKIKPLTAVALCLSAVPVDAIEFEEYVALKNATIELCRGGTLEVIERRTEGVFEDVDPGDVLRQAYEDVPINQIRIIESQWSGILALIGEPNQYTECVQHALETLIPALKEERNIATDLNARIKYIRSNEFCERLRVVIDDGLKDYIRWKQFPGKATEYGEKWAHRPFLMANPEILGMTFVPIEERFLSPQMLQIKDQVVALGKEVGQLPSEVRIAYDRLSADLKSEIRKTISSQRDVSIEEDGRYGTTIFSEPIVILKNFDANRDTPLLMSRIESAIHRCVAEPPYEPADGVRYRRTNIDKNDRRHWGFDRSQFLADSRRVLNVSLSLDEYPDARHLDRIVVRVTRIAED